MYNSTPFGSLNGTTASQPSSSQQQNSLNPNVKPVQTLNYGSAFPNVKSTQKQQPYNPADQQNKRSNTGLYKRGVGGSNPKTSSFSDNQTASLLSSHSSPFKGSQFSQCTVKETPLSSPFPYSMPSQPISSIPSGSLMGNISHQMSPPNPSLPFFSFSSVDRHHNHHRTALLRHSGFQAEDDLGGGAASGQAGLINQAGIGSLDGSIGEPVGSFGGGFGKEKYSDNRNLDGRNNDEYIDEPPLLEELGINPEHILKRIRSVLLFYRLDQDLLIDCDMCGPVTIAACLGCCLLLSGKAHFGHIYSLSITGCVSMYVLLNLMSQKETLDLYRTTSILGYGLMPIVILSMIAVFVSLRNSWGAALSILCVWWCTATASRFFETALQMYSQRYLIAYPIALLYACFVLITVF